jgi:hypothetical protein
VIFELLKFPLRHVGHFPDVSLVVIEAVANGIVKVAGGPCHAKEVLTETCE